MDDKGDVQKKYTFQLLSEESAFPSEQDLYLRDLELLAPPKDEDDEYCALVCWPGAALFSKEALIKKARLDSPGGNFATPKLMVIDATSVSSLPIETYFEADLTAFPFPTVLVTSEDGKTLQKVAEAGDPLKASLGTSSQPVEQRSERASISESKDLSSESAPVPVSSRLGKWNQALSACARVARMTTLTRTKLIIYVYFEKKRTFQNDLSQNLTLGRGSISYSETIRKYRIATQKEENAYTAEGGFSRKANGQVGKCSKHTPSF